MNNVVKTPATEPEGASARTMRERLGALLGRRHEALSPWVLRRTLAELQAINDPAISDVEGGRLAAGVAGWYAQASPEERRDCWLLMSQQFAPDVSALDEARREYEAALGKPGEAEAEVRLRRSFISPRTRLLQRFAAFPEGLRFLVDLRAELLPHLRSDKRLVALDAELEALFTTWFDVAFLDLQRISWQSPAALVEKLIKYEAVHDVTSWADAKNRLDEDRRCYGFFHPRLPGEPLIFVEVALLQGMADSMPPLLDETADAADLSKATTAIVYSIRNTQTGLKGVGFGDSLIKRVVETLRAEFPQLKEFATLSPIPGFRGWLGKQADALWTATPARTRQAIEKQLATPGLAADALLAAVDKPKELDDKSPLARWLQSAAARFLGKELAPNGRPLDAVARFHLGNGARVERLNWLGDPSAKGVKQSYGLMVNYLYDLKRLDKHRAQLAKGSVPVSKAVENLLD